MQPRQLEIIHCHITDATTSGKDHCPNLPCTKVFTVLDVKIQRDIRFQIKSNIEDSKNFNPI